MNFYKLLSIKNDIKAFLTFSPKKYIKRLANKWIGRNIVAKLWFR